MKKKTKSNFIIDCCIYPFEVMVSIDQTDDELFTSLKPFGYSKADYTEVWDMSDTTEGKCIITASNHTIIRLRSTKDKYRFIGNISHEVFHAVTFIMWKLGMKLELETSDEAYSYLIGYLTEKILKELKI